MSLTTVAGCIPCVENSRLRQAAVACAVTGAKERLASPGFLITVGPWAVLHKTSPAHAAGPVSSRLRIVRLENTTHSPAAHEMGILSAALS